MVDETISCERWKYVVGCEDYEVSDLGQVRRSDTKKLISFKPDQRRHVSMKRGGTRTSVSVARLVLTAFEGHKEGMICCHNNGNCCDDRLVNLRWDTCLGNSRDMLEHGTNAKKLTLDIVREIRAFDSSVQHKTLAEKYGVAGSTISLIRANRIWVERSNEKKYDPNNLTEWNNPRFITIIEICDRIGVSKDTIHKRIKAMGIKPKLVGKQLTFVPSQVRKIAEYSAVKSKAKW